MEERLLPLVEHAKLFEQFYGEGHRFEVMRKHYRAYANSFAGAKKLRAFLMESKNADDTEQIITEQIIVELNTDSNFEKMGE